jgi:hypothetical protein
MLRAARRSIARTSTGTFGAKRMRFTQLFLALVAANLVHGEAAFSDHMFEGNASFGVLPEVLPRGAHGLAIVFAQPILIWIYNRFEQLNHRVQLNRPELIEQLVGVLLIRRHSVLPEHRSCRPILSVSQALTL